MMFRLFFRFLALLSLMLILVAMFGNTNQDVDIASYCVSIFTLTVVFIASCLLAIK